MKQEIRIVIADDHPLMRQGLRQVIEIEPHLKVVGEAGNGSEALAMIEELKPDAAILDVDMPHQDGFQVARALAARKNPAAIIFLTIHSEEQMFHAALDLGAKGYVLKDSAIDDIVTAINEVVAGRAFTSLPMTTYFTRRQNHNHVPDEQQLGLRQLTPTEYRILKLLADYKTNKDIAEELSVSPRTVETHRARICQKLNLQGSHALMKFAAQYKSLL
ncbi:MAG: response regulator transcription factor [Acidobacteria bacterium]|nr:response regulator transcription factor [Acidobacteriota bacterium]